jgi:hypothetical protein
MEKPRQLGEGGSALETLTLRWRSRAALEKLM